MAAEQQYIDLYSQCEALVNRHASEVLNAPRKKALADFIAFSSPEAIVLFGGLAKAGDYIFKPIQKAIDDNVLNIYKGKTKLLASELKDSDAAVLGASALGWELRDIK